jgi:hypothetical protein
VTNASYFRCPSLGGSRTFHYGHMAVKPPCRKVELYTKGILFSFRFADQVSSERRQLTKWGITVLPLSRVRRRANFQNALTDANSARRGDRRLERVVGPHVVPLWIGAYLTKIEPRSNVSTPMSRKSVRPSRFRIDAFPDSR